MTRARPLHALRRRWTAFLAVALSALVFGIYFTDSSTTTRADEKPVAQNLVTGRLAFTSIISGPTLPDGRIWTSNPDGSGQSDLPLPLLPSPSEPGWSPDGTKIAYANLQSPYDIYKINANGSGWTNLTNTQSDTIAQRNPSWSATGIIAYERSGQIWTMNEDGSGQAHFSAITQSMPTGPAWSPDGSKLAFSSGGNIWVINADGTDQHQVTSTASTDTAPDWSPDGTKIAFTKSGTIAVIDADGTNETALNASGTAPSWSPDGTKIAFVRAGSTGGIFTMSFDGSNQVRIVFNSTQAPNCCDIIHGSPDWQPVAQVPNTFNITGRITDNNMPVVGATVNLSGSIKAAVTTDSIGNYQFSDLPVGGDYKVSPSVFRHYFTPANRSFNNLTSNQTGNFEVRGICQGGKCVKNGKIAYTYNGEIYVMNPDGSSQQNITNLPGISDTQPNYSPDGLRIVFSTNRDGNYEIYRMDEDGIGPVRLTNDAGTDSLPFYSPDGETIVFVSNRDGNNEIYKMNADGTNQMRLTNNTVEDTQPAFSPDGQKILFASRRTGQNRLFTMNTDGSDPQQVLDADGPAPLYERPSYSPDGSKIIVTYTRLSAGEFPVTHTMNADGSNRTAFPAAGRMGSYSPDGSKVVYSCCQFDVTNTYRVRRANADGTSMLALHSSGTGYDMPDWQGYRVSYPTPYDFDGDGRSDMSVFRPTEGIWYQLRSTQGYTGQQWGIPTDVLVPADYDGDLKTDVAIWRPEEGNFYILNSFDGTIRVENFGLQGDVPTGGDWDGDGKADVAVYRDGAQGTFYYRGSMGNPTGGINFVPWGISGDKPVVGDYDGDGRTDAAIYRNGVWYVLKSSDGQLSAAQFGLPDDDVIPADYDADGKTDMAVYREGVWYLLRSSQGFSAFQFGIANDIPAPADYDGDGRADAAVYRNGIWWILNSQSFTATAAQFGLPNDKPVPAAYVR